MNCCDQQCNQGRACPVRQACQLPDQDAPLRRFKPDYGVRGPFSRASWSKALGAAAFLFCIALALAAGFVQVR